MADPISPDAAYRASIASGDPEDVAQSYKRGAENKMKRAVQANAMPAVQAAQGLVGERTRELRATDPTLTMSAARVQAIGGGLPGITLDADVPPPPADHWYNEITQLPKTFYRAVSPQTYGISAEQQAMEKGYGLDAANQPSVGGLQMKARFGQTASDAVTGIKAGGTGIARMLGSPGAAIGDIQEASEGGTGAAISAIPGAAVHAAHEAMQGFNEALGGGATAVDAARHVTLEPLTGQRVRSGLRTEGPISQGLRVLGTSMQAPATEAFGRLIESPTALAAIALAGGHVGAARRLWNRDEGLATQAQRHRTWRDGHGAIAGFGYDMAQAIQSGEGFMSSGEAIARTQGHPEGSTAYRLLQLGGFAADSIIPVERLTAGPAMASVRAGKHYSAMAKLGVPRGVAAAAAIGHELPTTIRDTSIGDVGKMVGQKLRRGEPVTLHAALIEEIDARTRELLEDNGAMSADEARIEATEEVVRDTARGMLGDDALVHFKGLGRRGESYTITAKEHPAVIARVREGFALTGGDLPRPGMKITPETFDAYNATLGQGRGLQYPADGVMTLQMHDAWARENLRRAVRHPSIALVRWSPMLETLGHAAKSERLPAFARDAAQWVANLLPPISKLAIEHQQPIEGALRAIQGVPGTLRAEFMDRRRVQRRAKIDDPAGAIWESLPPATKEAMVLARYSPGASKVGAAVDGGRLRNLIKEGRDAAGGKAARKARGNAKRAKKAAAAKINELDAAHGLMVGEAERLHTEYADAIAQESAAGIDHEGIKRRLEALEEPPPEARANPRRPSAPVKARDAASWRKVFKTVADNKGMTRDAVVAALPHMDPRVVRQALGALEQAGDFDKATGFLPTRSLTGKRGLSVGNKHVKFAAAVADDIRGTPGGSTFEGRSAARDAESAKLRATIARSEAALSARDAVVEAIERNNEARAVADKRWAEAHDRFEDLDAMTVEQAEKAYKAMHDEVLAATLSVPKELLSPKTEAQIRDLLDKLGHPLADKAFKKEVFRAIADIEAEAAALQQKLIGFATAIEAAFMGTPAGLVAKMSPQRATAILDGFGTVPKDGGKALSDALKLREEGGISPVDPVPLEQGITRLAAAERVRMATDEMIDALAEKHFGLEDVDSNKALITAVQDIMSGRVPSEVVRGKIHLTAGQADPAYAQAAQLIGKWGLTRVYDKLAPVGTRGLLLPGEIAKQFEDAIERGKITQFGMRVPGSKSLKPGLIFSKWQSATKVMLLLSPLFPTGTVRYLLGNLMSGVFSTHNFEGTRGTFKAFTMAARHPKLFAALMTKATALKWHFDGPEMGDLGLLDKNGQYWSAESLAKYTDELASGQARVEFSENLIDDMGLEMRGHMPWLADIIDNVRSIFRREKRGVKNGKLTATDIIEKTHGAYRGWVNVLFQLADGLDTSMRLGVFLKEIEDGRGAAHAVLTARKALLDFDGAMTPFERDKMRKVFLFYAFTRANFDNYLYGVFADPSRIARQARFLRELPEAVEGDDDPAKYLQDYNQGRLYSPWGAGPGADGTAGAVSLSPIMPITSFLGIVTNLLGIGQAVVNAPRQDSKMGTGIDAVQADVMSAGRDVLGATNPAVQMGIETVFGETAQGFDINELSPDNRVPIPAWLVSLDHSAGYPLSSYLGGYVTKTVPDANRKWKGDDVTYYAKNEYLWRNAQKMAGLGPTLAAYDRFAHGELAPGMTTVQLPTAADAVNKAARDAKGKMNEDTAALRKRRRAREGTKR